MASYEDHNSPYLGILRLRAHLASMTWWYGERYPPWSFESFHDVLALAKASSWHTILDEPIHHAVSLSLVTEIPWYTVCFRGFICFPMLMPIIPMFSDVKDHHFVTISSRIRCLQVVLCEALQDSSRLGTSSGPFVLSRFWSFFLVSSLIGLCFLLEYNLFLDVFLVSSFLDIYFEVCVCVC